MGSLASVDSLLMELESSAISKDGTGNFNTEVLFVLFAFLTGTEHNRSAVGDNTVDSAARILAD